MHQTGCEWEGRVKGSRRRGPGSHVLRQHAALMEGNRWHKTPSPVPLSYAIVPALKPLASSTLRPPCLALVYCILPFKYCIYVLSRALRLPCLRWLGAHLTHNYPPGNWLLSRSNSFRRNHYTASPPPSARRGAKS